MGLGSPWVAFEQGHIQCFLREQFFSQALQTPIELLRVNDKRIYFLMPTLPDHVMSAAQD